MKLEDIRGKESAELQEDLQAMRKELFQLRFKSSGDVEKPSRFRELRRSIARVHTVLRQREIEQEAKS